MYQPSTNFIGKDPMRWWIGQVTDPDKGKWGDSLEKQEAEDGKEIYSHRCRVRIVGYHGCEDDLKDEDLPLAHVLLPPNTSTTGGQGQSMQYQGGEVVVGFFFDGDDGQQPVIFGTLFKQTFIEDKLTNAEFNAKKQTCFKPYTPPQVRETAGKHVTYESKEKKWSGGVVKAGGAGEEDTKNIAHRQFNKNTEIKIDNATACQDNELSKITNAMKDFTQKLQTLQKLNSADVFVNPIYGGIVDIQSEIKLTSNKLQNSMTKLVRRGRSWVINDTLDKLSTTLKDKTPLPLRAPTGKATKDLSDVIFCNFEKIQDGLLDYLNKSLENMIGQVLDVPTCGIENFLGDMFGQINNILDTQLGGLFDQLNNIQGGGIALPSKTFSKAIKFANIITNVLECDAQNCPDNSTYSSKNGVGLSIGEGFDNIIGKMGISSLLDPLLDGLDGAIPALPSKPDCDTSVLRCGPPRVDFIGGGGQGATGSAIVNVLGQIIGVAISDGGFGFTEPPLLSFVDSCENGYGAGGFPVMGEVTDPDGNTSLGVTDVVITNPGQGFLPNTTETDFDGNVKEVVPDPNANYDGEVSYVTTLESVVVENTGFGYDDTDTASVTGGSVGGSLSPVDDSAIETGVGAGDATGVSGGFSDGDGISNNGVQNPGQAEVELIIQDGRIEKVNVVNGGFGFTSIPDITINSDTGALAKLTPVLKFTKIDDATQLADLPQIDQDRIVTVISCITK